MRLEWSSTSHRMWHNVSKWLHEHRMTGEVKDMPRSGRPKGNWCPWWKELSHKSTPNQPPKKNCFVKFKFSGVTLIKWSSGSWYGQWERVCMSALVPIEVYHITETYFCSCHFWGHTPCMFIGLWSNSDWPTTGVSDILCWPSCYSCHSCYLLAIFTVINNATMK